MWEKWVFLATLAACTCLMRTSVGNILASPGGSDFILGMLDESSAVAAAEGHAPSGPFFQRTKGLLTAEGSQMTASGLMVLRQAQGTVMASYRALPMSWPARSRGADRWFWAAQRRCCACRCRFSPLSSRRLAWEIFAELDARHGGAASCPQ
jgi:hypothetical protein